MSHTLKTFLKSHGWIVALALVFAAGGFYWSMSNFKDAARLKAEGVVGQAYVLESFSRRERKRSGDTVRYETNYYVRYRFTPQGAETITKRVRVNQSFQEATQSGAQIPVTYLPADPSVHEIQPGKTKSGGWMALALGAIATGIGGAVGWIGWGKAAKAGRLLDRGATAQAVVEAITPKGKNRYQLSYWFSDPSGARIRGQSKSAKQSKFDAAPPGTPITVVYDPDNPENNAWDVDLGLANRA